MNNMFNNSKFMDRIFKRVDGMVWDLMSGRIGIKTQEGIITCEGIGDDAQISVNPFDNFGMEVPAFCQSTPVESVQVGDLIYGSKTVVGWVVEKNANGSFQLMKRDGTVTRWNPPKVQMLGVASGVMVLRSLMTMLPGGSSSLGGMQQMMQMMMFMGGDMDMDKMMPLMLMSQMGNQPLTAEDGTAVPNPMGMNMNPMMMMMLMGGMGGMGGSKSSKPSFGGKSSFFDEDR